MPTKSIAAILVEPNRPLVIDEVELPDPAPDQVLVKLFASGICHSQLHQIHREQGTAHAGTPSAYPTLLGHESTAVVVAKGRNVDHVNEGDHVLTTWVDRDLIEGAPPRTRVEAHWGNQPVGVAGATWTEYSLLSERLVVPMPKDVATDVTSIVYRRLRRSDRVRCHHEYLGSRPIGIGGRVRRRWRWTVCPCRGANSGGLPDYRRRRGQ